MSLLRTLHNFYLEHNILTSIPSSALLYLSFFAHYLVFDAGITSTELAWTCDTMPGNCSANTSFSHEEGQRDLFLLHEVQVLLVI